MNPGQELTIAAALVPTLVAVLFIMITDLREHKELWIIPGVLVVASIVIGPAAFGWKGLALVVLPLLVICIFLFWFVVHMREELRRLRGAGQRFRTRTREKSKPNQI
jgi:fatty acid desaturase